LRKSERNKEEIKSKNEEMRSVNSHNNSGLQGHKMEKNTSVITNIHSQETSEDSEKKFIEC
jgi:hypothetical protein